ncbi:MAG: SIR2 family protein [Desulfomonilaceae bacterium]
MISALESLSFAVHSRPGLYALLIGSGVSRSAGIPTGWEITLDLVKQLAALQGEEDAASANPELWFRKKFSKAPNYSELLLQVARKSGDLRSSIIRRYFESDPERLADDSKTHQKAHTAIAKLVAKGYVRVIITTNFDRLIEKALDSMQVGYSVISTPSQAMGTMPLAIENCVLVKVNGDYRDSRILNTPEELAKKYAPPLARLIKRTFDEYGLIVCGWSGEYDRALRSILESCSNHRFTIFWASKGELKQSAKELIRSKHAERVSISDADAFFQQLADNVLALEKFAKPHPLSTKMAVAKLKTYLSDPNHHIDAHDLVMEGVHDLYDYLAPARSIDKLKDLPYVDRIKFYTFRAELLSSFLAIGCYHGGGKFYDLWAKVIEKITNPPYGLFSNSDDARGIAALILFYSAGIAAIADKNYDLLATLFFSPKIVDADSEQFVVLGLYPAKMTGASQDKLPLMKNGKKPYNLDEYLFDLLRDRFIDILPHDSVYCKAFYRLEYLAVLVRAHFKERAGGEFWGSSGRFAFECRKHGPYNIMDEIETEMAEAGDDWKPLKAGLFEGTLARAQEVKKCVDPEIKNYSKLR